MYKKSYRLISIILFVLSITASTFSQTAVAPSGSGTPSDPYLISTLGNLYWISQNPDTWGPGSIVYFKQTADINASVTSSWGSGHGFSPIGNDLHYFNGNYDGDGYTISGLYINGSNASYIGLFGYCAGAVIKNVALINVHILGKDNVGGLVGTNQNSVISNCYSTGSVIADPNYPGSAVGGLVGWNGRSSQINECYSTVNISGRGTYIGGLVGWNVASSVLNSFSTGNIVISDTVGFGPFNAIGFDVGGLIGGAASSFISNCYSTGNITSTGLGIGGLMGISNWTHVSNCYSAGSVEGGKSSTYWSAINGGLIGQNYPSYYIVNSFWDTQTSGQNSSAGGTAKTTDEMKDVATYTKLGTTGLTTPWDFVGNPYNDTGNLDYWNIDINKSINNGYPYLSWQKVAVAPPKIFVFAKPIILWPPNHKYTTIKVSQCVDSVSDKSVKLTVNDVVIAKVTSDEPENAVGNSDGNTLNDIVISSDNKSVELRQERQGNGNGRVYTIYLSVNDGKGNADTAAFKVEVPVNQQADTAIDDGAVYTVFGNSGGSAKIAESGEQMVEQKNLPNECALFQNYPNPFNPSTTINYEIPKEGYVKLSVYNSVGQEVAELVNGEQAAGRYSVDFNAADLASGVYYYKLQAGNFISVKKLILIK